MKPLRLVVCSAVVLSAIDLQANDAPLSKEEEAVQREIARLDCVKPRPPIRPLNNVSFSYQLGLNIKTTFKGFGGYRPFKLGTTAYPANHEYDDGYNRVDDAGNNHGGQNFSDTTTYWGYQNDSQWNHANNTIEMHSSASRPYADLENDDPRQGFQVVYERVMQQYEHLYWGLEAAFGFSEISVDESKTTTAPIVVTTDAYAIPDDPVFGGPNVPGAPYSGPFEGVFGSSLLSDIPLRSSAASGQFATVVSQRHFEANVWRLHLGPKLHVPVNNRLEFQVSGGLAVGVLDSSFNFQEQVTLPASSSLATAATSPVMRGSSQNLGVLAGGYLAANAVYPLTPDASIFGGVQWEDLGTYEHRIGTHIAEANFTDAISISVGFNVGF